MTMIKDIFNKVKKEFKVYGIGLSENSSIDSAVYDYQTREVYYNPSFVERNKEYIADIFRHELGHHKWLAASLENRVFQEIVLSPYTRNHKETIEVINLFNDVGVNYRLVESFKDKTKINELYKNSIDFKELRKSKLGGTLLKLLESLTGRDWGSETFDEIALTKLNKIPWKDRGWKLGLDYSYYEAKEDLINFYDAIRHLLPTPPNQKLTGMCGGEVSYNLDEKEEKRIAKKLLRMGIVNVRELSSWYQRKFPKKVKEIERKLIKSIGILPGTEEKIRVFPPLDIVLAYLFEIEKYNTNIEPIMKSKTVEDVVYAKSWDIGEPFRDIRFSSYRGIIIPGITPIKNVRSNVDWGLTHKEGYPNLLVILDDSGSREFQYGYGFHEGIAPDVVVAGVVAKKYLLENSKVGVIKFSGTTRYFGYFSELEPVVYTLASFEGGGTYLNIQTVKKAIQEGAKGDILPDTLLITDGYIGNAEELVEVFNRYSGRVWVFFMNKNLEKDRDYKEIWKKLKKGKAHFIIEPSDIINIVLG